MRKNILSILLALSMVLTTLPVSAMAEEVHTPIGSSGKITSFALDAPTEITNFSELQATITNASGNLDLKLSDSYTTTTGTLTISSGNHYNITIDLNGKTLDGSSNSAIDHNGSGELTITDSNTGGKVTSKVGGVNSKIGTINNKSTGKVTVSGGEVTSAGYQGKAISNYSVGNVSITGGTVSSTDYGGIAIYNFSSGNVSITGGTLSATSTYGTAIYNISTGNVSITGGTLSSTGTLGYAIYNYASGSVSISGGTLSATGANGMAFYNFNGIISIPSGTVILKGSSMALNRAPDLSNYADVKITANVSNPDDSTTSEIEKTTLTTSTIGNYKYLKFEPAPVSNVAEINSTKYTTLQAAVNAVQNNQTIKLLDSITLKASVAIDAKSSNSFTLDLNGKTLDGGSNSAINHNGSGELTITDSNTGGKVTSSTGDGTISNSSTGSVTISGGEVTNTGSSGSAIYNKSTGSVSITGGSVSAIGASGKAIYNRTTGKITISGTAKVTSANTNPNSGTIYLETASYANTVLDITGGTVENTGVNGTAIYNYNFCIIRISGGVVSATEGTSGRAIYFSLGTSGGYTIISGNTVVVKGSGNVMNKAPDLSSYTNVKVTASSNYDGSSPVDTYDPTKIADYKYLSFAENPDTAPVNTAKTVVESGSYTVMQAAGNTVDDVKKALAAQINNLSGMSATGVTVAVSNITFSSFTAASAGTSGKPEGTNGSFTFTVNLTKGAVNKTTASKTGTINATAYTGVSDTDAVAAAITAIIDGTVNVTYGVDEATKTAAVQTYVNSLLTGNAAGVTATVSHSNDNTYQIALNKGKVNNSKSITMTINENANPDIALVNTAKTVIEGGSYTMTQSTAATGAAVTAELVTKINNLPGMSSTSIEVTGSAIELTSFTAASAGTSGNPKGKNGGFTFKVTLMKGNESQTTDEMSGTITATVYGGVTDTEAVAAAKIIIEGGSYTMSQGNNTQLEVKAALENKINNLPGMSSTSIEVTGSAITLTSFTAASAGTSGNPKGKNGGFTFKVTLTRGNVSQTTDEMTGTITATAYVAPSGGNTDSGNSGTTTLEKKAGKIEKDQKQEGNAPTANLKDNTEDLKAKVLTAEEQKQVADGKDAKIILKVQDISTSVSAEDKKQIEEKLAAEQNNSADSALIYIDISLFKKIGDGEETRVTETSGMIKISIEVPESMWSSEAGVERTYRVLRIHNGVAEILEGTYDSVTHLFTFETDRFSTYALTYQDLNKATEEKKDKIEDKADKKADKADSFVVYQNFNHLRLSAKAAKTSQKLSYAKVAGADGYFIYGAKCGQKLKMLAEVDATVTDYTVIKRKHGTYYKYQVKAYKILDGKKKIIANSSLIRSVTVSKTYGNPTKITIKTTSITLKVGKTKKLAYHVVLPKNKKMKNYASLTRFETTNKKITTISSSGKITAKVKGTCYVYAYAQNGVYKKIRVTVE